MFEEDGCTRTSKCKLKTLLEPEVPSRTTDPYTSVIDGCAFLWVVSWPSKGATVSELCDIFKSQLLQHLEFGDFCLVFDRYEAISTKHHTRQIREKGYSRHFNLNLGHCATNQRSCIEQQWKQKEIDWTVFNRINNMRYTIWPSTTEQHHGYWSKPCSNWSLQQSHQMNNRFVIASWRSWCNTNSPSGFG